MRLACNGLPSWFDKKATIVTPSRLLANVAAQQFTRHQLARGAESWQRPAHYSVDAWLTACWQEARYSGSDVQALLSPAQERLVWQNIIEQEEPDLFDLPSTARLASGASRLLAEWQIPAGGELWNDYPDAQHFLRWYNRFRQQCREEGWITRSDIWRLLPSWISDGWCERQLTVFAAFDGFTPALEQVRNALEERAAIEPLANDAPQTGVAIQHCASFANEIEQAARWARATFEQQPRGSIAVLIPDLAAHRSLVERTFGQVFHPSAALHLIRTREASGQDGPQNYAFHVNAARPPGEHPIVVSALLILELAHPRTALADACAILRSPYIVGADEERSERALADLALRRRRDIDVSLRDIEYSTGNCIRLKAVWPELRQRLSSGSRLRDLPAWSEFIRDVLEALGWPGEADLSLEERDTVELWKNAVSALSSLGLVSKPVSYAAALARLRTLLSGSGGERGDWSSPVQVVDSSDASGLRFDAALLTGLSGDTWPPSIQASALVPLKVQRAYGVPASSRQDVYETQQRMTGALFRLAPSLRASYSERISPIAAKFTQANGAPMSEWRGKLPVQSYPPTVLDEIDDSWAPPFKWDESFRGGTGVIKSQSLCPFRAFAEYRLLAKVPEEACFGFDSRDRGGFLHAALQTVWSSLKTQDRLRSTPAEELKTLVHEAVFDAVRDDASSPFHELTTDAERERLAKLILEWLELERVRSQPFTVESVEQKRSYAIPGLRLDLRVDRMDRLKNGSVVLVDYKSGKQTASKLEGDRPQEPQLLVYAAAVDESVDGVFFGQLKPRELRAVGFGRDRHFPGRSANVKRDWDSFMRDSMANVETIATGFVKGEAVVDPLRGACDYCSQKPFCRIREKSDLAAESDIESE